MLKSDHKPLAGSHGWLEHYPMYQKVVTLIPSEGTCLEVSDSIPDW